MRGSRMAYHVWTKLGVCVGVAVEASRVEDVPCMSELVFVNQLLPSL